jgi:hypothetical protein
LAVALRATSCSRRAIVAAFVSAESAFLPNSPNVTVCSDVAAEISNSLDANSAFCHTFHVLILTLPPPQLPLLVPALDFVDVCCCFLLCIMSLLLLMLGCFGNAKTHTSPHQHQQTTKSR